MHTCYLLANSTKTKQLFSPFKIFTIVFSGLCHDVGHTGFTNLFEIASGSKKAITYNDNSVFIILFSRLKIFMLLTHFSCWRNLKTTSLRICLLSRWKSLENLWSIISFTQISRNISPSSKNLMHWSRTKFKLVTNTLIFYLEWSSIRLILEGQLKSFRSVRLGL